MAIYPLVMTNSLLLKMAIEIVDFPINSMVMFHSYVTVYQRVLEWDTSEKIWQTHGTHKRSCGKPMRNIWRSDPPKKTGTFDLEEVISRTWGDDSESLNNLLQYWLVVLTILKNISQWEGLSHYYPIIHYSGQITIIH